MLKRAGMSLSPLWDSSLCPDWETSPSSPSFDSDLQGRADNPRQEIDSPPQPHFYAPLSLRYLHFQHSVWGTQKWIEEMLTNNGNLILKGNLSEQTGGITVLTWTSSFQGVELHVERGLLHHSHCYCSPYCFPCIMAMFRVMAMLWCELQCTWLDCGETSSVI